MAVFQFDKIDLNDFWDRTPTKLKYILIIAIFLIAIYFLFSRTVSNAQIRELEKIEQTIETTHELIERFEEFRSDQYVYNAQILVYLDNIYTLIQELNQNINRKFEILVKSGNMKNSEDLLDKILLLNESFEKLQDAYTPEEFQKYMKEYQELQELQETRKKINIKKDSIEK